MNKSTALLAISTLIMSFVNCKMPTETTPPKVTLSDLKYTANNQLKYATLSVDVRLEHYANQHKVLGLYWLRSSGSGFCFQPCNVTTSAPGNALGALEELNPTRDNSFYDDITWVIPYLFFPVTTSGTTYYGYAVVYDRIDVHAVEDVNASSLAQIGPPDIIVSLRF